MIVGYTAGAFDLFHIGHLNLLRESRALCDKLIVGVSTDELVFSYKGKTPVIPFSERMEIVGSIKFVDEVVVQKDIDKLKTWHVLKYSILFVGDDWKGSDRWNMYENQLLKKGVKTIYLPYTNTTSSTLLTKALRLLVLEKEESNDVR